MPRRRRELRKGIHLAELEDQLSHRPSNLSSDHRLKSMFNDIPKSSITAQLRIVATSTAAPQPQTTDLQNIRAQIVWSRFVLPAMRSMATTHVQSTKDIESGGYEALEKLKRELNIKHCPRRKTPMEKTAGCNHMTCGGCKAQICWACMAVFEVSEHCYDHMRKKHGGFGIVEPDLVRWCRAWVDLLDLTGNWALQYKFISRMWVLVDKDNVVKVRRCCRASVPRVTSLRLCIISNSD